MRFFNKKQNNQEIFTIQEGLPGADAVYLERDDAIFEETFASRTRASEERAKFFVGFIIPKERIRAGLAIVLAVFLLFTGKASALQLVNGDAYRIEAENNRIRSTVIPAQRGIIYDRNGVVLAQNEPAFQVVTSMEQLPLVASERDELLRNLAAFFQSSYNDMIAAVEAAKHREEQILLVKDVTYEDALRFESNRDFPGIFIEVGSRRSYITNSVPSLSHILGYTGILNEAEYKEFGIAGYRKFDYIGKHGVEQTYETHLRGRFGEETAEVDALGRVERIVSKRDPVDGKNINITIDVELQTYIEETLIARMEGSPATKASVIVMEPGSGEILGMVSWPAYDANLFTRGIDHESYAALTQDPRLPLFPRAYVGEFPSGSTIKPVFAAAALEDGIVSTTTSFFSTGGMSVGPWFFPDWRAGGHGPTNVYHAIADSVNTFFYMIGGGDEQFIGLGLEGLMQHAARYGFGKKTGIDLSGEADGFLPSREWKVDVKGEPWYIGDTYHVSIGQGDFLSTPLQIAQSTAIFANGGERVTPHLRRGLETERERVVSQEISVIIQDAMRQTVTRGSATSMQLVPVSVAGKTGTAQWSSVRPNHSWFTGFAPYEDPQIVITVLIEEGGDNSLSVPVARDILTWWFSRLTIE